MKGLSFQEFYDRLYCGADIDMRYGQSFFHINAGAEKGEHGITVYKSDKHPDEISDHLDEIYEVTLPSASASVERFLQAKIFDGKSISEIQNDVVILYS